jgi:hypothetical protein
MRRQAWRSSAIAVRRASVGNNRRRPDRRLQAATPGVAPTGDQGTEAQLGHRRRGQEQLVPDEPGHRRLEGGGAGGG